MKLFFSENAMMKILNLFEYYSLNNQLLDQNAINNIINICLIDNNMFGIVNEIVFVSGDYFISLASYDKVSKNIYINPNSLYTPISKCNNGLNNYNSIYLINQKIIFVIFHELCHAISFNKLNKNNKFINRVIDYTLQIKDINFSLYLNEHDNFPYEREADVFAYEHLLWLIERMDYRIIDDNGKRRVYYNFMMRLLSGYGYNYWNNSPLQSIVDFNDYNAIINDASQYNLNLYERLEFGLPISLHDKEWLVNHTENLVLSRSKEKCLF